MTTSIIATIMTLASINGIDPYILAGLINVESRYNQMAVGSVGERGLMQLKPKYFGYDMKKYDKEMYPVLRPKGKIYEAVRIAAFDLDPNAHLFDPNVNLELGVKYLAQLKKTCLKGVKNGYLVCYNRGPNGAKKVENPEKHIYAVKVLAAAEELKKKRIFSKVGVIASN